MNMYVSILTDNAQRYEKCASPYIFFAGRPTVQCPSDSIPLNVGINDFFNFAGQKSDGLVRLKWKELGSFGIHIDRFHDGGVGLLVVSCQTR